MEHIKQDSWLSNILEKESFSIVSPDKLVAKLKDYSSFKKQFCELLQQDVFIYTKIVTDKISTVHTLQKYGFFLVDTNITFEKKLEAVKYKDNDIVLAEKTDKDCVLKIAKESFVYSRFHLDPYILETKANEIKFHWVKNFFLGQRGDFLIVSKHNNEISGFCLVIEDEKSLIIDLIATDKNFRRKGVSSKLISYLQNYQKKDKVIVGTQVANTPSLRFYEKQGFKIFQTKYILHYHRLNKC